MFVRTDVGLSSEYLFYGVDFVVYCEGPEEANAATSHDELFWSAVLGSQGIRCKCKSVGSKSNVRPIAEKVASSLVKRTIAAMDRDYDEIFGDLIVHPNVLYTHGYSWENDVLATLDIHISTALFFDVADLLPVQARYDAYRSHQTIVLKRACLIDIAYVKCDQALFDREKPMAIIAQKAGSEPTINRSNLIAGAKRIGRGNRGTPVANPPVLADPFLQFYGKAVSKLIYFWFVHVASSFPSSRKTPYDTFMAIALKTASLGDGGNDRDAYYADMCGKIAA